MSFIHVYTGNGKGKTTCAVGLAVRALGAGLRVAFIQFDKGFDGQNEHYNERHVLRKLDGIDVMPFGLERMMPDGKFRFQNSEEDVEQALAGLEKARSIIMAGEHQLVILDELVTCTGTKLLTREDVLELVQHAKAHSTADVVITGRSAWDELIQAADLVTEMALIKHYWYDRKVDARPGIDY